jgi:hypothetical protein
MKLAIIRQIHEDGNPTGRFSVLLEGDDGEFKRELASRVRSILGAKKSFTHSEITGAINSAFEQYKTEFKEKSVKLK